jgi:hypothetical protein
VANVLQHILNKACDEGLLEHPIVDHLLCLIQYADGTSIICKANSFVAKNIFSTLEVFSISTGLHINFDKNTFVPNNVHNGLS